MVLKAFNTSDDNILSYYEALYIEMLKTDRACEADIMNKSTPLEINDQSTGYTIGYCVDVVRNRRVNGLKAAHSNRKK